MSEVVGLALQAVVVAVQLAAGVTATALVAVVLEAQEPHHRLLAQVSLMAAVAVVVAIRLAPVRAAQAVAVTAA
jgi:hypothetical protein